MNKSVDLGSITKDTIIRLPQQEKDLDLDIDLKNVKHKYRYTWYEVPASAVFTTWPFISFLRT